MKTGKLNQVEQHNQQVQQGFAQQMEGAFSTMQRCIQQQGTRHHDMLSSYSQAFDSLLVTNEAALKGALSTVQTVVGGVGQLVAEGMARCQERVQQATLCVQEKEGVLQLLEEHRQNMEEVLVGQILVGLSAIGELSNALRASVETQRALADKLEAMKEMGVFFSGLVQELAGLRETTVQGLSALQAEHVRLENEITQAQERHQQGINRTMQCLQDQLSLLAMEAQKDYAGVHATSRALQKPLKELEEEDKQGQYSLEDELNKLGHRAALHR